ncbi:MAG: polysaccharide biosynthesis C-terminal domain-containing protein [Lachnospiraceae bacterium]|nr:polysaccharide biosynthesis C-terminal domain-containing protein [Lachnospiraceae bacterium]
MTKGNDSIISGGFISSLGIFFTKFLGILYAIPLTNYMGSSNGSYFIFGSQVIEIGLGLAISGFPFATAALISVYQERGKGSKMVAVERVSGNLMTLTGLLLFVILWFIGPPLSKLVLDGGNTESLQIMTNVFRLSGLSLLFVSQLGNIRGFFQGLKDMRTYANSQLFEQISKIVFLVASDVLLITILKFDSVYGLYIGILAFGVSALMASVALRLKMRRTTVFRRFGYRTLQLRARWKMSREILQLAVPYALMSVLSYGNNMIEMLLYVRALKTFGLEALMAQEAYGVYGWVMKIISIPLVLAPGFSIAIIPYLSQAVEQGKRSKINRLLREAFEAAMIVTIPLCLGLAFYAKGVLYMFYGADQTSQGLRILGEGVGMLKIVSLLTFISVLYVMCGTTLIALGLRRKNMLYLGIGLLVKLVMFYPCTWLFGYLGSFMSTILSSIIYLLLSFAALRRAYGFQARTMLYRMIFMGVVGMLMIIPALLFDRLPLPFGGGIKSRLLVTAVTGVFALLSASIYLLIMDRAGLLKAVLKRDLSSIFSRLKRQKA